MSVLQIYLIVKYKKLQFTKYKAQSIHKNNQMIEQSDFAMLWKINSTCESALIK